MGKAETGWEKGTLSKGDLKVAEHHRELITEDMPLPGATQGVLPVAKVMRLKGPTGKGESGLKGALLDLLVHLPQNQSPALPTAL